MNLRATVVPVKNKLLLPRSGHKIVADDNYLYVIGGFVERKARILVPLVSNEVRGEIWRMHLVYKTWELLSFDQDIFCLGASHSATKVGSCIFITGGTGLPFGKNILADILVIDLKKMTQRQYVFKPYNNINKNMPVATYGHSITHVTIDDRPFLYMIGGTTGTTYFQNVYKIDLLSLESVLVADFDAKNAPKGRYKHESFLYGDDIYVLGGTAQNNFTFSLDEIHAFNIHTNSWSVLNTKCSINETFRCPSMCQNGRYIYLTGGSTGTDEISESIFQLDLVTLSWSKIGLWIRPCFFHDSVFVPHLASVYTFGGVHSSVPAQRNNDLYQFSPFTALRELSLFDLAWNSVINVIIAVREERRKDYSLKDAVSIKQDLVRIGLPCSIVTRMNVYGTQG